MDQLIPPDLLRSKSQKSASGLLINNISGLMDIMGYDPSKTFNWCFSSFLRSFLCPLKFAQYIYANLSCLIQRAFSQFSICNAFIHVVSRAPQHSFNTWLWNTSNFLKRVLAANLYTTLIQPWFYKPNTDISHCGPTLMLSESILAALWWAHRIFSVISGFILFAGYPVL